MTQYTIKSAAALTDDQLDTIMGNKDRRDRFRATLAEATALTGEAKKMFEKELNRTLNPTIYVDGLDYDLRRAKKKQAGTDGDPEVAHICCGD